MLHIAVCDDEHNITERLGGLISVYLRNHGINAEILTFQSAADLLTCKLRFDLIFLDIEMPETDGIEAAKRIRKNDMHVPIVYVTSYTDYWKNAYSVHAFDFIVKPFSYEDIKKVLDDFMHIQQKAECPVIELQSEKGTVYQKTDDILYFYVENKKRLIVCTNDKKFTVKMSLSEVRSLLDDNLFFSPHRCCIVNLKQISTIENRFDIIMANGEFLPLAQRKEKDFLLKLHKALRGDGV